MPRSSDDGFVLLGVLWALILLALLALPILAIGRQEATDSRLLIQTAQAQSLAEGGVASALNEIINHHAASRWRIDGIPQKVAVGGRDVWVSVQDTAGMIDLSTVDKALLSRLLEDVGVDHGTANAAAEKIVAWRSSAASESDDSKDGDLATGKPPVTAPRRVLHAIEELEQAVHLPQEVMWRLSACLTVFSQQGIVDRRVAPKAVRDALADLAASWDEAETEEPPSLASLPRVAGRGFAITAIASSRPQADSVVETTIRVTGDAVLPYRTLEWRTFQIPAARRGFRGR